MKVYRIFIFLLIIAASCVKMPDPAESISVRITSQKFESIGASQSLTITGSATNPNKFKLSSYGVCWTTDNVEPTIKTNNSSTSSVSEDGVYQVQIQNIQQGKSYKLRPYVKTSSGGVIYGSTTSFTTPTFTSIMISSIKANSALVTIQGANGGSYAITERGVVYSKSSSPKITGSKQVYSGTGTSFSLNLTNLDHNTRYYARAYVTTNETTFYGEERNFTTLTIATPTLSTSNATNITATGAQISGEVLTDGNADIIERGIVYSTSQSPTTSSGKVSSGSGIGSFTATISSLSPNVTYYARAYARNSIYTGYGNQITFKTQALLPTLLLSTIYSSSIGTTSVTLSGNIITTGGDNISEKGFVLSETTEPKITDRKEIAGSGTGSFSKTVTGLKANTTYYVRAYATNSSGSGYSETRSFKTTAAAPSVSTTAASNIKSSSATLGGNVTSDNGNEVTERGIYYSIYSYSITYYGTKVAIGSGSGVFSKEITNLSYNTNYYYIAYAKNDLGTSYGETMSFNTSSDVPALTTTSVTSVTSGTAQISVNITSDGGANITERGVVFSKSTSPDINDSKVTYPSSSSSFSVSLTNLDKATKYYVRAFAKNKNGTAYGNELNFTTLASPATVTTSPATSITTTEATINCEVTDDGGGTITERGIVYGSSQNPTTSNTKVTSGSGKGYYSVTITSLTPDRTYYARAYAINNSGTSYGQQIAFTTEKIKIPTVTTNSVTSITAHTANASGKVTNDGGGTISIRGFQISTYSNLSGYSTISAETSVNSDFSSAFKNLTANTKYYYRAYANNSAGSGFGDILSFTTSNATIGTLSTIAASNIGANSATVGGSISSNGNSALVEIGVRYSDSYNTSNYLLSYGTKAIATLKQSGDFTINISSLAPNRKYYYIAYATNLVGVASGSVLSFTTSSATIATVSTSAVSNISIEGALVGGNVTSDGNSTVTSRGVVISTSPNPTINNTRINIGSGTGSFSQTVTSLNPNTKYYIRAFAYNSAGYSYGSEISFTTLPTTPAQVSTSQPKGVTHNSATLGGNITNEGNSSVTERGVVYSMLQNPSVGGSGVTKLSLGTGVGSFEGNANNLTSNTIYYARAFATNKHSIAYGTQVSFTTDLTPPTFSSVNVYGGSSYGYFRFSCTVSAESGTIITERGFVYSKTNSNPTTADTKVASGSGTGTFETTLTSPSSGVYYVKAYSITSKGTFYSNSRTVSY